jgi:putative ABC transport system permease protein
VKTLFTLALRYLLGRKLRTVLTTLAVVFGVMVLLGVNVLLPSMVNAVQGTVLGASGAADLTVNSPTEETFGTDVLSEVQGVPGVTVAVPALRRNVNLPGAASAVELVGLDLANATKIRPYATAEGRFLQPGDTRSVVVAPRVAQAFNTKVGGTLNLPTPQGLQGFTLVGILAVAPTDQILMPLETAQALFAAPGRINTIDITVSAGTTVDAVKADLERRLGAGFRVGTGAGEVGFLSSIQIGVVAVNIFAVLTLFMAGFLIFNTFRAVVVERRHDLGLLRAVGATRRTVVGLILMESVLQGVVGTIIGLALGYLLAFGLTSAMSGMLQEYLRVRMTELVITPGVLALAIGLGIGVTMLAGLAPAYGASRVPVLEALRPAPPAREQRRITWSSIAGAVVLVLGVVALIIGTTAAVSLGLVLVLVGLIWIAPALIRPFARVLDPLTRTVFSREGTLAEGNLQRQPGRAAVTASAVMIALAIIVALSSMVTSFNTIIHDYVNRSLGADVLLVPPAIALWSSDVGAGEALEQKLAAVPGVAVASGLRFANAQANGVAVQVLGIDPTTYPKVAGLGFDEGDTSAYGALAQGRAAIASPIYAKAHNLHAGDTVQVSTPDGVKPYRLVAIGTDYLSFKVATLFISQTNMAADFHRTENVFFMANLKPGADQAAARRDLAALLEQYPQFTLAWGADFRATQFETVNQAFLGMTIVLLILTIPSLLGLVNTLAINVMERTREIGVLRAIGATQGQVRRMVLAEALLLSAAGAALGIAAGIAMGYALTALVAATMSSTVTFGFPWLGVLAAIVVALALGMIASVVPARQAARLQIVRALQYE